MSEHAPVPPTDGLREEIAQAIRDRINVRPVWTAERLADHLLASPGVRRLIAAEEAVRRVRALADRYDQLAVACDDGPARVMTRSTADRIRRALDGDR